jgi:hypothetical protein
MYTLIKFSFTMANAAFKQEENFSSSKLGLNLRKKIVKCYLRSVALYGAETWKLKIINT